MKTIKQELKHNIITAIINQNIITAEDRRDLIRCVGITDHAAGSKIYGTQSINTSVIENTFCKAMHSNTGAICSHCYAWKLESFRASLHAKLADNRIVFNAVLFTVEELAALPIFAELVRLSSFGELETVNQARNYIRIAKAFPSKTVALWTKNTPVLQKAIDAEGKPSNLVIIQSSKAVNIPDIKIPAADRLFTVYDRQHIEEALKTAAACNGKSCGECGYKCYRNTHQAENIAEVLR